MAHSIRLTRIVSRTNQIAAQLQELQFGSFHFPAAAWKPAINVYAFEDRFEICVDLAGVPKDEIEIEVDVRRLVIQGRRPAPEQCGERSTCCRVLMLEIEDGQFERSLELPVDIDPARTEARQENGWLWIILPFAAS